MLRLVCLLVALLCCCFQSPLLAEHSPERKAALLDVRRSLSGRQLEQIAAKLKSAAALKGEVSYDEEYNRLELLAKYITTFWEAVDQGAAKSLTAGELNVDGQLCSVVEYDRRLFVIRSQGENKRYTLDTLPPKLALVLSQLQLPKQSAANQVCFGAFLAMDGKGDRRLAAQYWQDAGTGGADVAFLLPELKMPLAAPPVQLPPVSPAMRTALAPAQWSLQTRKDEKSERKPLGKQGTVNEQGRLEIPAPSNSDTQLLYAKRITGDFTCRVFFDQVTAEQAFGLYPAVPSEKPVLIALPAGTVKLEFMRRKGEFYCRINDQDVLVKVEKAAEKMTGYVGIALHEKQPLIVGAMELTLR
jgi:hypothetical protein